jgi:hypothetical protein
MDEVAQGHHYIFQQDGASAHNSKAFQDWSSLILYDFLKSYVCLSILDFFKSILIIFFFHEGIIFLGVFRVKKCHVNLETQSICHQIIFNFVASCTFEPSKKNCMEKSKLNTS